MPHVVGKKRDSAAGMRPPQVFRWTLVTRSELSLAFSLIDTSAPPRISEAFRAAQGETRTLAVLKEDDSFAVDNPKADNG